jgi:hypothetical protein
MEGIFQNEYTITPDKFVTGITWGISLMALIMTTVIPASIFLIEKHLPLTLGITALMLVIFIPLLYLSWAYSPQKYQVSEKEVRVVRPMGDISIPVREIRKIEEKNLKAYKLLRKWGNGGLFSVSGKFWSKKEGDFWCYAKNNNWVMLHADKKWVVSPDEKELFISDVTSKMEKKRK